MRPILKIALLVMFATISTTYANENEVQTVEREEAYFLKKNTVSDTSAPTSLQYYEFKENLPDEISIDIYSNKNMSEFAGKKIFVGYGAVDPTGKDCKVFTPDITGNENNITICLPWWRVEREYMVSQDPGVQGTDFMSFIATMQRPRPPKNVIVCNEWQSSDQLPGGTVTCTTYYDKTVSSECYENPRQAQCKKNNCGTWVEENCERIGRSLGYENESLYNVEIDSAGGPQIYESKVDLVTEQFVCPGGSFTNYANCADEEIVAMHPYECKPDNPDTPLDDSIMKYCDENSPIRNVSTGKVEGFVGECPAEASSGGSSFEITCTIDYSIHTRNVCTEPGGTLENITSEIINQAYELDYTVHSVNVLSGAEDVYSAREECVRSNTLDEGREDVSYIQAEGSGYLDDDIYLTVHSIDDTHNVVYCNQQHNGYQGSILNSPEFGSPVQCIPNDGNYAFNETVTIIKGDIVSVQQATEAEDAGFHGLAGAFAARTHYLSSSVVIDGIEATPATYISNFPYYPSNAGIRLWENTLGSLALLFPYAGNYNLFFYNISNDLVASKNISRVDFEVVENSSGYKQLFLAEQFDIAPGLDADDTDTLCLMDNFVDYGGGVFGGRASLSGSACQEQASGVYSKSKAINKIVVKDELNGTITIIPLVYPLGYPNRLFISKLKLYENREYHCYEEPTISAPQ